MKIEWKKIWATIKKITKKVWKPIVAIVIRETKKEIDKIKTDLPK